MTALALTACAKNKQGPAASPGSSEPGSVSAAPALNAKDLRLDLVKASARDPGLPGEEKFKGGVSALQPTYVDQEIILNSTLNLDSGDRLAFVWPQGDGRSEITSAVFAARAERSDNRVTGEVDYEAAGWDRDGKRWFIPFDRIRRIQDFGPADTQVLLIRLGFQGGQVLDFTIRFHAAGPLVALQIVRDEQIAPSPTLAMLQGAAGPVNLRRLTVVNPMARKVNLWVKVDPSRSGPLIVGRLKYHAAAIDLLTDVISQSHVSRVQVSQGSRVRSISLDGWTPIRFEPGESLALDWQTASGGCSYDGSNLSALMVEGTWAADSWLTDESVTAMPSDPRSLSNSLGLDAGRAVYTVSSRTGNWDGQANGSGVCSR
jgi:hypothetical protein